MKRTGLVIVAATFSAMSLFGASAEVELYLNLYTTARTQVERLDIARDVAILRPSDAVAFYAPALTRLVTEYPSVRSSRDRDAADSLALLLADLLSSEGYRAAGDDLWRMVQSFDNPLVKAGALTALGKIGAVEYLPQIIQLLNDLNTRPSADRLAGDRIAYGAIQALEYYQNSAGYLPVFFASTGWYPERTKSRALAALPKIMADPSEILISVIRSTSYNYEVKYLALQTLEESNISASLKSTAASAGYAEVWPVTTNDTRQRMIMANIRKLSIGMIREHGLTNPSTYPLLDHSCKDGIDEEERLSAVAALGSLKTEDSARILAALLQDLNVRQQRGLLTSWDERLVRALIPALGSTGQASAATVLRSVQSISWTPAVKTLAQEALKKIP